MPILSIFLKLQAVKQSGHAGGLSAILDKLLSFFKVMK